MLMNSSKKELFYELLHVNQSTKRPVFSGNGSPNVSLGYRSDNLVDYSSYYNHLIDLGYPLIVMAGEFDMQDGIATQYEWMKQLLNVPQSFWEKSRNIYRFGVDSNQNYKVGGYWIEYSNFTLLTVPKSGHFIPANYYEASINFLDDMVSNDGKLMCQNASLAPYNCSTDQMMIDAMANCSGQNHSNGVCQCDLNYKGADCGIKVVDVEYNTYLKDNGTKWFYFAPNRTGRFHADDFWFSFNVSVPYDLYISQK